MTLLHIAGPEAIDIYNMFQWLADQCKDHCDAATDFHIVDCILSKSQQYFAPRKNVTIKRRVFF